MADAIGHEGWFGSNRGKRNDRTARHRAAQTVVRMIRLLRPFMGLIMMIVTVPMIAMMCCRMSGVRHCMGALGIYLRQVR